MIKRGKSDDNDKIKILSNAVQCDKDRLDDLCEEFDLINPKSHKAKLAE